MRRYYWIVLVCIVLSGCASTVDNLQRETARSIGGNMAPEAVMVSNIQRGVTSVRWHSATPQGMYQCSADDMVQRVHCVRE